EEYLVDEVDVLDPLALEPVDLGQYRVERPAAVAVAEVFLGAERAVIRAAARGLDLGAKSDRLGIEAMMVVAMTGDRFVAPDERLLIDELRGQRSADDADVSV